MSRAERDEFAGIGPFKGLNGTQCAFDPFWLAIQTRPGAGVARVQCRAVMRLHESNKAVECDKILKGH
ncbi:hypothetical protein NBRC116599_41770 [Aquicoccus sp. SU-CL01552]